MAATREFGAPAPAGSDATVIGESILISGKLTGDEDLTVRGRVEGELSLSKTLIVEPSGIVKANVSVRNAIVSGVVVGNISAIESVELTKEGRMVGDIRAPRVIIVDGASFRGRVDMGNAEPRAATDRPQPASRPLVRPNVKVAAPPVRAPVAAAPKPPAMQTTTTKPLPPVTRTESKPPPPPPPSVMAFAEAGKKKVLFKKKK